jgi:hypothetical protein
MTQSESMENVRKRRRKSAPIRRLPSSNKLQFKHGENIADDDLNKNHDCSSMFDKQRMFSSQFLTRIENHMKTHLFSCSSSDTIDSIVLANQWTVTERSLFRLFYFLFNGDLCSMKDLFTNDRTCQDMYEQFILDTKYFSDRVSLTHGQAFVLRPSYRRRMLDGATRAFLLHVKKNSNQNQKSNSTLKPAYQPCLHDGPCTLSNLNCHCMQTGTFCEKFCHCSVDCPHRYPGCACKGACLLNNCLCCAEGRECDPDLCHKCGASLFPLVNEDGTSTMKLYVRTCSQ